RYEADDFHLCRNRRHAAGSIRFIREVALRLQYDAAEPRGPINHPMSWTLDDIIVAVASPPGPGARGIVRAPGPRVQSLVAASFPCEAGVSWMTVRRATRIEGRLDVAGLSIPLPCSLWFWPNHRSYAGQPTIEIHTIGSPPILDAVVQGFVH